MASGRRVFERGSLLPWACDSVCFARAIAYSAGWGFTEAGVWRIHVAKKASPRIIRRRPVPRTAELHPHHHHSQDLAMLRWWRPVAAEQAAKEKKTPGSGKASCASSLQSQIERCFAQRTS